MSDNVIEILQANLTAKLKNKSFGSGIFSYNGIAEKIISANAINISLKVTFEESHVGFNTLSDTSVEETDDYETGNITNCESLKGSYQRRKMEKIYDELGIEYDINEHECACFFF